MESLRKFVNLARQKGPKALTQRVLVRLFPGLRNKPVVFNVQAWLDYYQGRAEFSSKRGAENATGNQPLVSILILTYNNLLLNQLCLRSIYCNTTYPNFEVIVVDNGSADGTPDWLKDYAKTHSNLKVIFNSENRGFSAGNNQAADAARGEYLIFLNNDTVVTQGWVEGLLTRLQADPEIGLVGPVTNAIANEARIPTGYKTPAEMETFASQLAEKMKGLAFDIHILAFYCVMCRKAEYESLGGLDERYSVGMFEDDDLAVRYRQEGLRIVCAEDVFIHHFHRSSFGKLEEETHRKIFEENRKKYEEKWARPWQPYQYRPFSEEILPRFLRKRRVEGVLEYRCNICGRICETPLNELDRERPTCRGCGSSVRTRSIVHILSTELFGQSLALPDFPTRRDLIGWGMSDAVYSDGLERKLNYVNTFYHKEPRLDITAPLDPSLEGKLDFLISTEVFEHITPPVSVGFENVRRLLKPDGVLIFSVPYTLENETREHFPELFQYEIIDRMGPKPVLRNITRGGEEQRFENLVFHGGPGSTLEMRVFSKTGLLKELKNAGFNRVRIYSEPCWEFGIYWHQSWSLPLSARL